MGRLSEKLMGQGNTENESVIQVVSRAFDILRCFEGPDMRLGNRDIADRCGLPRSTVSRLMFTLTRIGQLVYLPREQKYALGPHGIALGAARFAENCDTPALAGGQELVGSSSVRAAADQLAV